MKRSALMLACSSLFLFVLSGCGGGGGTPNLQQKTATIIFSTVSSVHSAPLQGIELTTRLPAGASVSDISTAIVGRNETGQLVLPSYNSPVVSFDIIPTSLPTPIKFGPFASLTCNITPGVTLNQSSFSVVPDDIQMTGTDASGTTQLLQNQIPVTLSVTFGF